MSLITATTPALTLIRHLPQSQMLEHPLSSEHAQGIVCVADSQSLAKFLFFHAPSIQCAQHCKAGMY